MNTAHPPGAWKAEFVATTRLALPLALAGVLQMATFAIDVIFIARLGAAELAASSLAIALFGTVTWSLCGLTGASGALIAAEVGRKSHAVRDVRRTTRMAVWLAVACGALGMAICSFGEELMRLSGQDPAIAAQAGEYLDILLWAMPIMIVSHVLRTFVATLGQPLIATVIIGLGIIVNAVGNYALIFGNLGAPAMGLDGAAYSTLIGAVAQLAAYIVAIEGSRRLRRFYLWGRIWRADWQRFREVLKIGYPVAVTVVAEAGFFSGAAFLMGRIGATELAGHTLAINLASFAFQVPFGLGQAASIRVGYHYGAGDHAAIARAGWTAIAIGAAFSFLTASAMLFTPYWLLSAYVDVNLAANATMIAFAVQYMVIAAAFQLFDGVQAVATGALRGLQDTRTPMAYALFGYWVPGLACAIGLGFFTPLAGTGVWIGLAVGLVVVAALMLWRWGGRDRLNLLPRQP